MRALWSHLFPRSRPTPATRLSPAEAAAVAERAAALAGHPGTHGHAVLAEAEGTAGGVIWDVCQVSIGSGWRVRVNDATGEAGPVWRWGLR